MRALMIIPVLFVLSGCGSSSSDPLLRFFPGTWAAAYNILIDDCGLLPEGDNSFTDEQTVTQTNTEIVLESAELPSGTYTGQTRSDSSFTATNILEGDLFGVGVNCMLTEDLAYNDLTDDSAQSIYTLRIVCDDGTTCDSFARGSAERIG